MPTATAPKTWTVKWETMAGEKRQSIAPGATQADAADYVLKNHAAGSGENRVGNFLSFCRAK